MDNDSRERESLITIIRFLNETMKRQTVNRPSSIRRDPFFSLTKSHAKLAEFYSSHWYTRELLYITPNTLHDRLCSTTVLLKQTACVAKRTMFV